MAKTSALQQYTESAEIKQIAKELQTRYYFLLGHVELDKVFFCLLSGDRPSKSKNYLMSGVASDWIKQLLQDANKKTIYCFAVWDDFWDTLTAASKQWILLESLFSIDLACSGKFQKPDVIGYSMLLQTLYNYNVGPIWQEDNLPNLLEKDPIIFGGSKMNDNLDDD